MCLWLLTACFGLLPAKPATNVIVVGVPTPILQPTTVATTVTPFPTLFPTLFPTSYPGNLITTAPPTTTTNLPITSNPPPITPPPTNAPPTTTTQGGELLQLILCNDPDVICVANPDESDPGLIPIDPRLGTTPAPNAAYQAPQIVGYSFQQPSYNTAVKFPREKRNIKHSERLNGVLRISLKSQDSSHERRKRQSCLCVPAGTCITSGAGNIDFRVVTPNQQCPAGQVYCCGINLNPAGNFIACGTQQSVPAAAVVPGAGQANFGEYPWQAMILTRQNDYVAGGVLIDQRNVLTVTHRMVPYLVSGTAPNIKVRLGEWDAAGTYEPVAYQEYTIQKTFSHPSYNPVTLQYDITVLRLSSAVPISPLVGAAPTINRACLPPNSATSYVGRRCWVSGWGKNMFGLQGQYQQILKEVDLPIVNPATCQAQLQAARLGSSYVLDTTSFLCAGGEPSKDSCTGDGGSGLVCESNGQWTVVGLVSWGLGCANTNVPAVYVNIAALLPWIQQQVATP